MSRTDPIQSPGQTLVPPQRAMSPSRYADWKAPAQDQEILIWPEPQTLLGQTLENQKTLRAQDAVRLQGVPLSRVRTMTRALVQHPDDQPMVVTGHQTELYHAGVWAKHALIHAAARCVDGCAYYVAVDTDAPKHLHLRWPGESAAITDDPRITTAAWSGLLDAPSPAHLDEIGQKFSQSTQDWPYKPALYDVLESLREQAAMAAPLSAAIVSATHELDRSLGLRHRALLASPLWMSEGFLIFAHSLLADAARFAHAYNDSLAQYREANDIRTLSRPMPDLFAGSESVETPFWLDNLTDQSRTRLSVFARDGQYMVELLGGEEFTLDPACDGAEGAARLREFLAQTGHRLSPRALTLTLFIRLCMADNFVHGIGGGRYDQVADRIIEAYFQFPAPKFAVATATMLLPQALQRQRACLPCIVHEGHQLKHRVLGEYKMRLVQEIESLPRGSLERGLIFSKMHQQLRAAGNHPTLSRWQHRLREMTQAEAENAVLFDRELFYAIQPRERLEAMIEQFAAAFTG